MVDSTVEAAQRANAKWESYKARGKLPANGPCSCPENWPLSLLLKSKNERKERWGYPSQRTFLRNTNAINAGNLSNAVLSARELQEITRQNAAESDRPDKPNNW
eukprot:8606757-Pyramimonas_sp.AAC.1